MTRAALPRPTLTLMDMYERFAMVCCALALGALTGCGTPPKGPPQGPPLNKLDELLARETVLYPLMTERDLYKLIYQATMGPGHLFMGRNSGLDKGLDAEIAGLKASRAAEEPLFEVLDPSRNLARVNLRPFLRKGGKAQDLARAVARTAHAFRGNVNLLQLSLKAAGNSLEKLVVSFDRRDLARYASTMKAKGFPPGVHSERYARTYEPAYRIVFLHELTDRDYGGRYRQDGP